MAYDGVKRKQINRQVRAKAFAERMAVQGHYDQFKVAMVECEKLARQKSDESNAKFAKWLKVAEMHWKVCDKYLAILPPPEYLDGDPVDGEDSASDTQPAQRPVSRAAAIVERLLGERLHRNHEGSVPAGSLVPAPVRLQTVGHGAGGGEPGLADGPLPGSEGEP